jgi:DNA-binding MarR family transcriptional regulator
MSPTALQPRAGGGHLQEDANQLLAVMSSIRRSGRLLAGRPVELSTLTTSQLDLVRLVLRRPGCSVAQAATELHLAANTVSTLVKQLTDQQVMTRLVDPGDRRVARLELTPRMRRQVGEFRDRRVATLASALGRLSPAQQRSLRDALSILEQVTEELQDPEQTRA